MDNRDPDLRNLFTMWIVVASFLTLLIVTGCASGDVKTHTLVCVIFCIDTNMEIKKGADPYATSAPTSLDGLVLSPEQRAARDRSRARSPAK